MSLFDFSCSYSDDESGVTRGDRAALFSAAIKESGRRPPDEVGRCCQGKAPARDEADVELAGAEVLFVDMVDVVVAPFRAEEWCRLAFSSSATELPVKECSASARSASRESMELDDAVAGVLADGLCMLKPAELGEPVTEAFSGESDLARSKLRQV